MLKISYYDGIKYPSTEFIARDLDFFGNGALNLTDFPLTYPATPNMTVQVGAGTAWVDGFRIANDTNLVTLTIPAASSQPRIDIIQIGHDDINKQAVLMVKQGVPSGSPIEPGADAGYVKLYAISVGANVTSITSSNVTDRRALVPLKVSGSQISYAGAAGVNQANTFAAGYTQTFAGPVALQAAVSLAAGQTFTNSGTITGGTINASSAPWSGVTGKPTTIAGYGITDNLVGSLTAGANITVSNPSGLGAATVGLTGVIPIANGGTGSSTQNFVDLSTAQTIGGAKTFSGNITQNGSTLSIAPTAANNDALLILENTNSATTQFRRKTIFSSNNDGYSGNGWIFRSTRPSDGANINTYMDGNGGTIWTTGNVANIVSSITAGANISVTNPTGAGAATVALSGIVPVANGGTGSSTQNFVDLTSNQTVGGVKTFSSYTRAQTFYASTADLLIADTSAADPANHVGWGIRSSSTGTSLDLITGSGGIRVVPASSTSYTVVGSIDSNGFLSTYNPAVLSSTSGTTRDLAKIAGAVTNVTGFVVRQVRTATGSDWGTAALDLLKRTDATDQQYIRFDGAGNINLVPSGGTAQVAGNQILHTGNVIGSSSQNGYLKIPNSSGITFIYQQLTYTAPNQTYTANTNYAFTVNLPISFPNAIAVAVGSISGGWVNNSSNSVIVRRTASLSSVEVDLIFGGTYTNAPQVDIFTIGW